MSREYYEKQIETWKGYNRYIVAAAKEKLKQFKKGPAKTKAKSKDEKYYFNLNKAEQVELILAKGLTKKAVPRFEKQRVKLLMRLYEGGE